jgi:hypothetical protein
MSSRLADLMMQLRDPSRWPPAPARQLVPATVDELRAMTLTADDLQRWLLTEPFPQPCERSR